MGDHRRGVGHLDQPPVGGIVRTSSKTAPRTVGASSRVKGAESCTRAGPSRMPRTSPAARRQRSSSSRLSVLLLVDAMAMPSPARTRSAPGWLGPGPRRGRACAWPGPRPAPRRRSGASGRLPPRLLRYPPGCRERCPWGARPGPAGRRVPAARTFRCRSPRPLLLRVCRPARPRRCRGGRVVGSAIGRGTGGLRGAGRCRTPGGEQAPVGHGRVVRGLGGHRGSVGVLTRAGRVVASWMCSRRSTTGRESRYGSAKAREARSGPVPAGVGLYRAGHQTVR